MHTDLNTLESVASMLPILYSFRRCPYAIRARLALRYSGTQVELREVVLADKPENMLQISPKGTVPVLQLTDGMVLEESLDIMYWALSQNDPDGWLSKDPVFLENTNRLIEANDGPFKKHLDLYKYSARFPEYPAEYYRDQANNYLSALNTQLMESGYFFGDKPTLADMAIFPFIRQFAFVDKHWFDNSQYSSLQLWLESLLKMDLFNEVMQKYSKWKPGDMVTVF